MGRSRGEDSYVKRAQRWSCAWSRGEAESAAAEKAPCATRPDAARRIHNLAQFCLCNMASMTEYSLGLITARAAVC